MRRVGGGRDPVAEETTLDSGDPRKGRGTSHTGKDGFSREVMKKSEKNGDYMENDDSLTHLAHTQEAGRKRCRDLELLR